MTGDLAITHGSIARLGAPGFAALTFLVVAEDLFEICRVFIGSPQFREAARFHVFHPLGIVVDLGAIVVHAALRIVLEELRIGADAGYRADQLDLRIAAPAEGEMHGARLR